MEHDHISITLIAYPIIAPNETPTSQFPNIKISLRGLTCICIGDARILSQICYYLLTLCSIFGLIIANRFAFALRSMATCTISVKDIPIESRFISTQPEVRCSPSICQFRAFPSSLFHRGFHLFHGAFYAGSTFRRQPWQCEPICPMTTS
jgi:hypothetical protein